MSKHTPAPWSWEFGEFYGQERCKEIGAEGRARMEADARLIAAAPELLEALEALWKQALQSTVNDPANEWGTEALAMARAAIAKAKGTA